MAMEVKNLCKVYPTFALEQVSFCLEPGKITGFIGRNGAGKTTTLRSILGLLHRDGGEITVLGTPFDGNECAVKQEIGYVSGGVSFYPVKRLKTITAVTRRFYAHWDDEAYRRCLKRFELDEGKTVSQLSEGMKVKYALTLALSHRAKLLILDEPTSGLDPVSRDELLEIFLSLKTQGVTILFSTHITSDLQRCADNLIYIQNGKIFAQDDLNHFVAGYRLTEFTEKEAENASCLIGMRRERSGFTALLRASDAAGAPGKIRDADLESIMIHLEREASHEKTAL